MFATSSIKVILVNLFLDILVYSLPFLKWMFSSKYLIGWWQGWKKEVEVTPIVQDIATIQDRENITGVLKRKKINLSHSCHAPKLVWLSTPNLMISSETIQICLPSHPNAYMKICIWKIKFFPSPRKE